MKFARLVVVVFFLALVAHSQTADKKPQILVIQKPTIVAFFPPISQADLDSGGGDAEALDDFNYYLYEVKPRLLKAGIEIVGVNERSFQVRARSEVETVQTGKIGIGYYFAAPGKKPHVEYGVMTGQDLLDVARKYFGFAIR